MLRRRHGPLAAAGAVVLVAAGAGGAAGSTAKPFSLTITGVAGTRYSGVCTLTTAAGERTLQFSGVVPRHEELTAEAVVCRIASPGSITVELARPGSRSRSSITAGTAQIAVR